MVATFVIISAYYTMPKKIQENNETIQALHITENNAFKMQHFL